MNIFKSKLKIDNDSIEKLAISSFIIIIFVYLMRKRLMVESLDIDEILNWGWILGTWKDLFNHFLSEPAQPSYYIFLKTIHSIFPLHNDYWFRIPSLALAVMSAILWLYHWQKRFSSKHGFLILFLILLFFNPLFRFVSGYARHNILLFLLCTILSLNFSQYLRSEKLTPYQLSITDVLLLGLLMNTHQLGVIWVASFWVTTLALKTKISFGSNHINIKKAYLIIAALLSIGDLAPISRTRSFVV